MLQEFCSAVRNRTPHLTRAYINKPLLVCHKTETWRSSGLCLPLCKVSRDSGPPRGLGAPKHLALVLRLTKQEIKLQPPRRHPTKGKESILVESASWLSWVTSLDLPYKHGPESGYAAHMGGQEMSASSRHTAVLSKLGVHL